MKIISWNVNGIRAVHKKGELKNFLEKYTPDIFCIQETKCKEEQIENIIDEFSEYHQFYTEAEKAGYSGTSIWIKKSSIQNHQFHSGMQKFYDDNEGRISRIDISSKEQNISLVTVYFPNGGKSDEAWKQKLIFYKKFLEYIQQLKHEGKTVIFCGDVNTCHHEIDIARPKANDGKIGFHPLERECLTEWENAGWKDIWREKNKNVADQYSWWSYRGGARERNVGWRIDYFFVPEFFCTQVSDVYYLNEQMGSDHCPMQIVI